MISSMTIDTDYDDHTTILAGSIPGPLPPDTQFFAIRVTVSNGSLEPMVDDAANVFMDSVYGHDPPRSDYFYTSVNPYLIPVDSLRPTAGHPQSPVTGSHVVMMRSWSTFSVL